MPAVNFKCVFIPNALFYVNVKTFKLRMGVTNRGVVVPERSGTPFRGNIFEPEKALR